MISFITPTFNNANYTNLFVESVKNQGEVIIVNDGGELYENSGCKVLNHEITKGMSAAFNTGYKAAKSDYLCFVDDDQVFCRNWGPPLIELLKGNVGIICSELVTGQFTTETPMEEILKCLERCKGSNMRVSANLPIFIKRETMRRVGLFDENFKGPGIFMDWDFYNRIAMLGLQFIVSDVSTSYHFGGVTRAKVNNHYWPNRYYFEEKWGKLAGDKQELFGRKLGGFDSPCF